MIMRKRAELDTVNPPGQIINRDQTIGGIIDRIMKDEPKKLTFDEWWQAVGIYMYPRAWSEDERKKQFFNAWKAAQENK